MEEFKKGKIIKLINGNTVEIMDKLGEGGQGIVYKVSCNNSVYALKWYLKSYLKGMVKKKPDNVDRFYKNLISNVTEGSPANQFLWPIDVTEVHNGSFGYIMELRRPEFQSFTKFLNADVKFGSTSAVIAATKNMAYAFQALHRKGYSYQDLNDGNFFVEPNTGDVLICDNDNVAPYGESFGIGGKSRYMAPEVVLGSIRPNMDTDLYSLSVVLFMFYFLSHPLEGKKVVGCACLTEANEKKFYAEEPIFICDPKNIENRPVRGIHNNVISLWPLFPEYFREVFIRAFTDAAKEPEKRILENEWIKVIDRLRDDLVPCLKCGEENFSSMANQGIINCCNCNTKIAQPLSLVGKKYSLSLVPGKNITSRHSEGSVASEITGIVVNNKGNPNLWGIRNLSDGLWRVTFPNADVKKVVKNEVVPILNGIVIDFGNQVSAEIKKGQ